MNALVYRALNLSQFGIVGHKKGLQIWKLGTKLLMFSKTLLHYVLDCPLKEQTQSG